MHRNCTRAQRNLLHHIHVHPPENIHSEQPLDPIDLWITQSVPHGLIAHSQAALVDAHLRAPHPRWLAQDTGVRQRGLRDADVRALKRIDAILTGSFFYDKSYLVDFGASTGQYS